MENSVDILDDPWERRAEVDGQAMKGQLWVFTAQVVTSCLALTWV